MFELRIALKYLIPRWRQFSVSIISVISVLVIALVVWLIVVFFSVTQGLERNWVERLIALTPPLRITPTSAYYDSYYHQIDTICSRSHYCHKSIGEKLQAAQSDPYDPDFDEELPSYWPKPHYDAAGNLLDPVKEAYSAITSVGERSQVTAEEFEMAVAHLELLIPRSESKISQGIYLTGYHADNIYLKKSLEGALATPLPSTLPGGVETAEGILLPKSFREAGAQVGDMGALAYKVPTASTVQEQQIPIRIADFYDPGILPIGGRVALVNPYLVSIIRSSYPQEAVPLSNGIGVHFDALSQADTIKGQLIAEFAKRDIGSYWNIQTFREFDYTKDILQQLKSEKNLFTIIASVIILIACSNIVSMLIILVNDKKMEIGILRSMGCSSKSIAAIFGLCGLVMGLAGSTIGIGLALFTLSHLQYLVDFLSELQGFEAFHHNFYGERLPSEISLEALLFVVAATALTSLIAGVVPALKASLLKPAAILRSE